jgi:hypothetical protein
LKARLQGNANDRPPSSWRPLLCSDAVPAAIDAMLLRRIFAHAATTGLFAGFKRPLSLARCAELMARRSRQTCMSFIRLFLPSQKQNPKNNSPWQPKDGIKKHINSFAFLRTTKMLHERITNPYHSQIYHDTEQKNVHCCTPFDADFFLAGDLRDINGAALPPFASLVFNHRSRHPTRGSPIPSVRSGFPLRPASAGGAS